MWKKKCPGCGKKVDRSFIYCPYCGLSFKKKKREEDFGMLGKDDFVDSSNSSEIKMPLGLNKLMNSLMKQLEKEMSDFDSVRVPRGFKIQISSGSPQMKQVSVKKPNKRIEMPQVSEQELARREKLKKVDAESKVRRLPDRIVYEVSVPGVRKKQDVRISRLEEGIEIKAYSKNKCYVKVIPLKVEILGWYLKSDVLFVELKG